MKIAVVVNLSKEKAISCAKEIAILFLGENAEVVMLSECKPFYKGINIGDINFYRITYIVSYFGLIFLFRIIFLYFVVNYKLIP